MHTSFVLEGAMRQSCEPYRGYQIDVEVRITFSLSFTGVLRRFTVLWVIYACDDQIAPVASYPENVDFISESAAAEYGLRRARAFIDCMARQPQ
ncbi:hypothetical protein ACFQ3P_41970 [Paraburkholderia sabiae]|uniref:Uncharacterized protein n=1 Tax=Paraburkholderia sabiae TaxID=273251 RepID=A0ABU9QSU8_9BURK|nr:hypothetical protein [Paraburkholderia sabiae]WJZ72187.1 hypothetical protein QEN71_18590 [Paraburkholderia sabiae]